MHTSSHDFVTVDMRGLKAALVARAQAERVSVSVLVRGAVASVLGLPEVPNAGRDTDVSAAARSMVKLSIRLGSAEAAQLAAGARADGLSRGAYLAGLLGGVSVGSDGPTRDRHLTALVASSAGLSTLGRDIRQLVALLRLGDSQQANPSSDGLDKVQVEVRRHLALASAVLSDLQPRRKCAAKPSNA